jgi:hypothetical protein
MPLEEPSQRDNNLVNGIVSFLTPWQEHRKDGIEVEVGFSNLAPVFARKPTMGALGSEFTKLDGLPKAACRRTSVYINRCRVLGCLESVLKKTRPTAKDLHRDFTVGELSTMIQYHLPDIGTADIQGLLDEGGSAGKVCAASWS